MNTAGSLDWFALERLYYEGCRLFLLGEHDLAIDRFKRIYEETAGLWDVAEIIEGYYCASREEWIAKFRPRFEVRIAPNKSVERIAAGARVWRVLRRVAAAIAHFFRST